MRKIVMSCAAAGAFLVAASPAAAQYYPAPQRAPYGYNNNGFGEVRALQVRIDNVQRQIARLDRRDVIRGRSADRLLDEANKIDRRLRERARGGLNPREANDIQLRIAQLEQRVQVALNDRGNRWGRRY
jgi:hypothetical protein